MDKVNTVNDDPRFQSYMSAEEDDRKLINSYIYKYYNDGVEEGKKDYQKQTILLLHDKGLSVSEISKYLELDEDKVAECISEK